MSEYRLSALDGLPCRVSGEWAQEKLHYLARYMAIFNGGMKNRWPHRQYIDLMAGPGRCVLEHRPIEFDGSPLLALGAEPAFTMCTFVESDQNLASALRSRTEAWSDRSRVEQADCNDPVLIRTLRRHVPEDALSLVFIDNLGLDVTFDTIRMLTDTRRMDLAITVQVNDIARNVPQVLDGRQSGDRFDRFFGTESWRQVVHDHERLNRSSPVAGPLTDFYADQLGRIGYAHVAQLHVLMRNDRNAPLYRLILAGKHSLAATFFRKISTVRLSGQREMF